MAKSSNVFDMERLLQYVDFMKENDLTEIDLEQDGQKVRLSRGGVVQPLAAAPAPAAASPRGWPRRPCQAHCLCACDGEFRFFSGVPEHRSSLSGLRFVPLVAPE